MTRSSATRRRHKLEKIFDRAFDLDAQQRAALLDRECGDDRRLRRDIEEMLEAAEQPTHIGLRRQLVAVQHEARPASRSGREPGQDEQTMLAAPLGPGSDSTPASALPPDDHQHATGPDGPWDTTRPDGHLDIRHPVLPGQKRARARKPPPIPPVRASPGATSPTPASGPALPAPGTLISQYELIRELGRGGMGAVFLARDLKLGRRVAIKFLQSNIPEFTERFILEARATARCSHENIVVIHDVNDFSGNPYMVLEYLEGKPFAEVMDGRKLPPYRAVELMVPVVRALQSAHKFDIVHRDLKPDNIFLTESGTVKVLDFGIAKFLVRVPAEPGDGRVATAGYTFAPPDAITRHGAVIGTMPYMSPEQWNAGPVDHRSDIWAIGIILFKMLTGQHPLAPLRGMQLRVTALLDQPMPSARDAGVGMPDELAEVIDRCLRKHPDQRYASAKILLDALEPFLPGRHGRELQAGESPYAGLTPFQEADADRFFGRSREVARMLAHLDDSPLVGVIGPSGVGKSSFVRAGVIPALKSSGEAWEALVVRPGRYPLAALANIVAPMLAADSDSLPERIAEHQSAVNRLHDEPGYLGTVLRTRARRHNRKIVLFVDQFEELYTLEPDQRERMAFTACLAAMADDAVSPLRVVLSLRSDFLDRVSEDRDFMAELMHSLFFLAAPDRDGLRDALVQPAEMARYRFEVPSMVDNMLGWLEATPGSLPLLQFTAARLWDARDTRRRLLTEHSYRVIGGIAGALVSHADSVMSALPASEQRLVRSIFLRMITADRTRAIVTVSELSELCDEPEEVTRLVDHLVDARLLVVFGDTSMAPSLEIVHESLVHTWPTLTRWLDESQEDAAYLEQLRAAARQWDAHGRPSILLWRGDAADEARRWSRRYRGRLSGLQQAYLAAVSALAARAARRKRAILAGTIGFLTLLVAAASVALVLIRDAEQLALENAAAARAAEGQARAAERLAFEAADGARRNELRAREAEREVRLQLALVQEKEAARLAAVARAGEASDEARQSKEDLARANDALANTLAEARQANKKLAVLLEKERERVARLKAAMGARPSATLEK